MQITSDNAVEALMRAGYGARGMVYFIVGAIAFFAAVNGGEAEGSTGALEYLVRQPFGVFLLGAVAAGLFAYTAWRLLDGALDLENEGGDAEGLASRAGQVMSGLTHAALGVTAVTIMIEGASAGGGGGGDTSTENSTEMLMNQPFGRYLVIAVGVITFSVGVYLFYKSWRASYKNKIRSTDATRRLAPAIRFGLVAHGFVLLIVGGLAAWAGASVDPEKAAGLGETLRLLETQTFGRIILAVTGAGLASFALYCFVMAAYRTTPTLDQKHSKTLADL